MAADDAIVAGRSRLSLEKKFLESPGEALVVATHFLVIVDQTRPLREGDEEEESKER